MWPSIPQALNSHATVPIIIVAVVVVTLVFAVFGKWFLRITGLSQDEQQ
ncbi:hypothetical protein [Sulfobacillus sp. hq2]|nr:hypothetical protein [Sulfobacillus sp. hq2]